MPFTITLTEQAPTIAQLIQRWGNGDAFRTRMASGSTASDVSRLLIEQIAADHILRKSASRASRTTSRPPGAILGMIKSRSGGGLIEWYGTDVLVRWVAMGFDKGSWTIPSGATPGQRGKFMLVFDNGGASFVGVTHPASAARPFHRHAEPQIRNIIQKNASQTARAILFG